MKPNCRGAEGCALSPEHWEPLILLLSFSSSALIYRQMPVI